MGNEMMEEIMKAYKIVNVLKDVTNELSEPVFKMCFCMLIEEFSKANNKSAVTIVDNIHEAVHEVNEELGRYGNE